MEPVPKVARLPIDSDGGRLVDCAYSQAGDRMATCGASGAVHIWACSGGLTAPQQGNPALLHSEKLPSRTTKLAWAPDEHGSILAAACADGSIHILQTAGGGGWVAGGRLTSGRGAIRDLAFAPAQNGIVLAAASDDGSVYVYEGAVRAGSSGSGSNSGRGVGAGAAAGLVLSWTLLSRIQASEDRPCSCISWRPFTAGVPPLLLASSSRGAKAWCHQQAAWRECAVLESPNGSPATALHWAPTLGRPFELAAASFGTSVAIFKLEGTPAALCATQAALLRHPSAVWRVEFNAHGNALGCSLEGPPPEVWLYMPDLGGAWRAVSRIAGDGGQAA